jgi:hypothetical protein
MQIGPPQRWAVNLQVLLISTHLHSNTRRYKGTFDSNPIEAYLKQKLAQAKHQRKAATE